MWKHEDGLIGWARLSGKKNKMNDKQIDKIQKVIDDHRKDMFVTCVETCPCWDIQARIDKWHQAHENGK